MNSIITPTDKILLTGAAGFIGPHVLAGLLRLGFTNVRCLLRSNRKSGTLYDLRQTWRDRANIEVVSGNLLSRHDCERAVAGASVIFHLAAGRGEKAYSDAFSNSVITTRNLVDAALEAHCLKRIVSISSFSVYSNRNKPAGPLLDELAPVDDRPHLRGDAYSFAKAKQDELITEYRRRYDLPVVLVRPGFVYGPGNESISGRVGIGTFGIFLHLGGANKVPLTYVENCADAIVLAGLTPGIDGEVFNVVDDELPSSRAFLQLYKRNVRAFRSVYVPHWLSYALCFLWSKYSEWSEGQLPPVFNVPVWHAYWKNTIYTNRKAKERLGWSPSISLSEGLESYFDSCRKLRADA